MAFCPGGSASERRPTLNQAVRAGGTRTTNPRRAAPRIALVVRPQPCFTLRQSRSACAGGAHEAAGGHRPPVETISWREARRKRQAFSSSRRRAMSSSRASLLSKWKRRCSGTRAPRRNAARHDPRRLDDGRSELDPAHRPGACRTRLRDGRCAAIFRRATAWRRCSASAKMRKATLRARGFLLGHDCCMRRI